MSQQPSWDLGRFVKTLSYFGAIPLLSGVEWFQSMMGSRPNPKVNPVQWSHEAVILVVGAIKDTQLVVQKLVQQGYRVRSHHPSELMDQPAPALRDVQVVVYCANAESHDNAWIEAIAPQLTAPNHKLIFDFTQPSGDLKETWGALDDVVMGGVSESAIRLENAVATFSGTVSTANSGGFASVRTRNFDPPLDLSGYEGMELRLNGDGNRYKCLIRCENRWDGIAYSYSFDTVPDQWLTVRISFSDLLPVFRAKTVDVEPIDRSHIIAFQLMLSKFEYDGELNPHFSAGAFALQIESIAAYGGTAPHLILLGASDTTLDELRDRSIPYQTCRSQDWHGLLDKIKR